MPQGKVDPANIPDDGLTTRQRRLLPVTAVHTGPGKGKSTAAFGMALRAWNQGMNIGVFQFVKSAKWKVGEEAVFKRLGQLHQDTGVGGPVEWHKMGEGWSWSKKAGSEEDHARDAFEGWQEIKRRLAEQAHDMYVLDEFTYPINWGWIDIADVVATLLNRPGAFLHAPSGFALGGGHRIEPSGGLAGLGGCFLAHNPLRLLGLSAIIFKIGHRVLLLG